MHNFGSIPETTRETGKPKEEAKKELEDSIINGERHENK